MNLSAPRSLRSWTPAAIILRGLPCLALGLFLGCSNNTTTVAPTVSSFTPAYGLVGSTIYVTGSGFSAGVSGVSLGSTSVATGSVTSDTALNFTVPTTASTGVITVATAGGSASSVTDFIVQPSGYALSTTTGSASQGTPVTITGYGMTDFTGVQVGGVLTTFTTQTANEVVFNVPAAAPVGAGTILTLVMNPNYNSVAPTVLTNGVISGFTVTQ